MSAIKQDAHTLIDTLPETTGWGEVVRVVADASFQAAVQDGIAAADQAR